ISGPICARAPNALIRLRLVVRGHHDWPDMKVSRPVALFFHTRPPSVSLGPQGRSQSRRNFTSNASSPKLSYVRQRNSYVRPPTSIRRGCLPRADNSARSDFASSLELGIRWPILTPTSPWQADTSP